MHVEIKFCGMTRPEDVKAGASLGARYVGVIFASGPRVVTVPRAREVLAGADGVRKVGVFGAVHAQEIASVANALSLDVVQLHGGSDSGTIDALRATFAGEIWSVLRLASGSLPSEAEATFAQADAVVLDANVPGQLGGSGVTLPWDTLAAELSARRRPAKLVLAGGLRPENVATAIRLLRPEIVDVSSGVETAPGIKDRARMRAFRDAVLGSE